MTPGDNGASTPEDDDPFGYLYADGQANGAQPPSGGYGYPHSVNRVRAVGRRPYGQAASAPAAGAPAPGTAAATQDAHGPNPHYAAPEALAGGGGVTGPGPSRPPRAGGGGPSRGSHAKGLLWGALAVVAAVVVGIGVAVLGGDSDVPSTDDRAAGASPAPSPSDDPDSATDDDEEEEEPAELPTVDAKTLRLGSGVETASDVQGAQSDGGVYVTGLDSVGSSVTWSVDGIPEDGAYTLFARYSAAGSDQSMTLTVNGKTFGSKLNMSNFAGAGDGDFAKGWTQTYAYPTLTEGTNTLTLSCEKGDGCDVLLDQLWLKKGQVTG
ncbi:carbohydrate-binding protein [Streptomyces sp. WMMC905]|uniref:carbohydrate-binding protein n=1 Tax=Streptomyces sp. WMMC905 TaxID=3404123 RepID=UPI003B92DCCD